MKYLVFSDLHGDEDGFGQLKRHPAFDTAEKVCLGDVGTFDDRNAACFRSVRAVAPTILLGNHEAVLIDRCDIAQFNPKVHAAIIATKQQLAANEPAFLQELRELPTQVELGPAAFTHGSFNPEAPWEHLRYIENLATEKAYLPRRINFAGHGHVPFIAWLDGGRWYYQRQIYGTSFKLNPDLTYIINVGSVLGSREMRQHEKTMLLFDDHALTIRFYNLSVS